jgi:hypothetical protein
MSDRLMAPEDLERVTGKKRYSKQAEWFKNRYGFTPVTCGDGTLIVTWATFEALDKRTAGLAHDGVPAERRPLRSSLRAIK